MKILAIESSGNVASIAIADGERLISEYTLNDKKTHSVRLMPMMDTLLKNAEIDISEVDVFAASIGPGSFTGLRIGISMVKGLADAANKPVVAVPTLDALANNLLFSEHLVCPIIDARNSQVYTALFETVAGEPHRLCDYRAMELDELFAEIKSRGQKVVFLGDGVISYRHIIEEKLNDIALFAPQCSLFQRASNISSLAYKIIESGGATQSSELVPFYIRKSQPEEKGLQGL